MMNVAVQQTGIDYARMVESARRQCSGAVVLFLGTVRELSEGKRVAWLEYEAHPPMAEKELGRIVSEAIGRWSLDDAAVEHRYGRLELGDVAVAVVTASSHRAAAFEAGRWIMDSIKQSVPIWKKEHWSDGSATWVAGEAESRAARSL